MKYEVYFTTSVTVDAESEEEAIRTAKSEIAGGVITDNLAFEDIMELENEEENE